MIKLTKEAKKKLSTQNYSKKPTIDGVQIIELKKITDDGGSFLEIARLNNGNIEGLEDIIANQISYSEILPTAIKAFHIHLKQTDCWFVPPSSRLLVVLHDIRESSVSRGVTMRFVLGDGKGQLVIIPQGVAHGCANPWSVPTWLVYLVTEKFDAVDPDEHRLPWDYLGKEIWKITKG